MKKLFLFLVISSNVTFASEYQDIQNSILGPKCVSCHNTQYAAHGIDLSSYEGVLKTVEPYDSEASELYLAITKEDGGRMPLMQPALTRSEIRQIMFWIDDGAYED